MSGEERKGFTMTRIIATLIATLIALTNTPAHAQGLFDVKLGGGGKGGSGRVRVTLPQLVDGLLSQWEPHGFKRRYVDRSGGVVIGEMAWFPQAVRYRLGRGAIPPNDIIQFPPDRYMMPLALAVGTYSSPKSTPKDKAEAAQLIAKFILGFKLNKALLKHAKGKKKGKVTITKFEINWEKKGKVPPDLVKETLDAREVKFAEQSWLLCPWANAPKANEGKANKNFDPTRPMACLVKVAFSFLNTKKKLKPVMAITLASLDDIPDRPTKVYMKDGKVLKKPILVPGPIHFLMTQYGFRVKDALAFGKVYPATLNSPVLREGLIDPYRRIDDNGQPIVKTDKVSDSSSGKAFTVFYWIAWVLIMIGLTVALGLFMNWLIRRFWSWNLTAKIVYVVLMVIFALLSLKWRWLLWGWFGLMVILFALPSIIQRPPPAANGQPANGNAN